MVQTERGWERIVCRILFGGALQSELEKGNRVLAPLETRYFH